MNKIYFSHIEKAAGTTLHEIFRNNSLFHYIDSPYKFLKTIDNQECFLTADELCKMKRYLPPFHSFGGHSVRVFENYEKCFDEKLVGMTILREPLDRYVSHFSHQKYIMMVSWTFDEFLAHGHFNNFMCKKICGEEDADKAIILLENRNVFVGIMEQFDESLILLKEFLEKHKVYTNFDIRYEVQNENKLYNSSKLIKDYHKQIVNNNIEDIKLYKYFLEKQVLILEDSRFSELLNSFLKEREGFKFKFLRVNSMKLFKKLYQKNLEKLFRDTSRLQIGG